MSTALVITGIGIVLFLVLIAWLYHYQGRLQELAEGAFHYEKIEGVPAFLTLDDIEAAGGMTVFYEPMEREAGHVFLYLEAAHIGQLLRDLDTIRELLDERVFKPVQEGSRGVPEFEEWQRLNRLYDRLAEHQERLRVRRGPMGDTSEARKLAEEILRFGHPQAAVEAERAKRLALMVLDHGPTSGEERP